ncbi:MAG: hypothetical protein O2894_11165 [Planctomycetota bacterium]|nr:hypothetical protein [Planctomycetota bacterium]
MGKTGWIVLASTFVVITGGTAGLLAVAIFVGSAVDAPEPIGHEVVTHPLPDESPPPALRGTDAAGEAPMARRLEALEGEVRSLREQLAAERKKTKPLVDMYEEAKDGGLLATEGGAFEAGGPGRAVEGDLLAGAEFAKHLARAVGLDDGRAREFTENYERVLEKVKALEKEHATVTKDGDTTTINIRPFGRAGEEVRREWDDYIQRALTGEERARYDKAGGRSRLLANRAGDWTRTVRIREAGGSLTISDQATDADGNQTQQEMQGPALARDVMIRDYAHLLR